MISLDYSSLVPAGGSLAGLTLGIGANDFQNKVFGQAFQAKINGVVSPTLSSVLNGFDQTGPLSQFFTIGLDPSLLGSSRTLTLTIDELGDGGDGWAVDYLTMGIAAQPTPEPATFAALGIGAWAVLRRRKRL